MKKQHTATFKAQKVKEIVKEEKTLVQIASEYGIHPQQLTDWKAIALRGLPSLFENERKTEAKIKAS
jgi:putative transposase